MGPSLQRASRPGLEPHAQLRRSFVYRKLRDLGARFEAVNGGAVALDFGRAAAEAETAARLGLADLSPLPRTGFKGTGAVEWLQAQGLEVGPDSNRGYRQPGSEIALRLAPTEIFLIDSLAGSGALIERLNQAWSWGAEKPRKLIGYPMPRADSHAWFALSGRAAPEMFAKICGIDLRLDKFEPGRIAQTSIAKMSAILLRQEILRQDGGETPVFHLLADSASADYLWDALLDAMAEFGGAPVGLAALSGLC
jgi:sarcosine oxidase, subunit gamma